MVRSVARLVKRETHKRGLKKRGKVAEERTGRTVKWCGAPAGARAPGVEMETVRRTERGDRRSAARQMLEMRGTPWPVVGRLRGQFGAVRRGC